MRGRKNNIKWSRGKSRIERVTELSKTIIAGKEKARGYPLKILNSLMQKGK